MSNPVWIRIWGLATLGMRSLGLAGLGLELRRRRTRQSHSSCLSSKAAVLGADAFNCAWCEVRFGSCVDGSHLARVDVTLLQVGRVQSCVRPVDAACQRRWP